MSKSALKLVCAIAIFLILVSWAKSKMHEEAITLGLSSATAGQVPAQAQQSKSCVIGGVEYAPCPSTTETADQP